MPNPILMRKLHSSLNAAALGGGGGGEVFPGAANLLLKLEATEFDANADIDPVTQFSDTSGNDNHFRPTSALYSPWVDQVRTINGHATVRFQSFALYTRKIALKGLDGATFTGSPGSGNWTAAEAMVVVKADADPPAPANMGPPIQFGPVTLGNVWPFVDGNIYEDWCDSTRPNIGNPTTSVTGWNVWNLRAVKAGAASTRTIILGSEVIVNAATGGTWKDPEPLCYMGVDSDIIGSGNSLGGNVAACYFWKAILTSAERTAMAAYLTTLFGITTPTS